VELKLSELQSAEVSLSIAVKKIEAQLTSYAFQRSKLFLLHLFLQQLIASATVSPTSSTLSILDELADRNRRKKEHNVFFNFYPDGYQTATSIRGVGIYVSRE